MYRYLVILALPIANQIQGLDNINSVVGASLKSFGVTGQITVPLSEQRELVMSLDRKLDPGERAKLAAAIEQQYAPLSAQVLSITFQGEDDTTPEEAPVNATGATLDNTANGLPGAWVTRPATDSAIPTPPTEPVTATPETAAVPPAAPASAASLVPPISPAEGADYAKGVDIARAGQALPTDASLATAEAYHNEKDTMEEETANSQLPTADAPIPPAPEAVGTEEDALRRDFDSGIQLAQQGKPLPTDASEAMKDGYSLEQQGRGKTAQRVEFEAGAALARDGKPLPDDASPAACEGYALEKATAPEPAPGAAVTPAGTATTPVTPPEPGQPNHGSAPQPGPDEQTPEVMATIKPTAE